jgi:hypothetical protein
MKDATGSSPMANAHEPIKQAGHIDATSVVLRSSQLQTAAGPYIVPETDVKIAFERSFCVVFFAACQGKIKDAYDTHPGLGADAVAVMVVQSRKILLWL